MFKLKPAIWLIGPILFGSVIFEQNRVIWFIGYLELMSYDFMTAVHTSKPLFS